MQDLDMRPRWQDYFLGLAFMASRRSRDIHTKHGCVIVDEDNHILGIGYNSWPAGMDDETIPNNRPVNPNDPEEESKYDWVLHAEENAILNSVQSLKGSTAYITGQPCHHCAMLLAQKGVSWFVIANRQGTLKESAKAKRQFERLIGEKDIGVLRVTPDLTWILLGMEEPIKLGFVGGIMKWVGKIVEQYLGLKIWD